MRQLIRHIVAAHRPRRLTRQASRPGVRLSVETLEDRTVLSANLVGFDFATYQTFLEPSRLAPKQYVIAAIDAGIADDRTALLRDEESASFFIRVQWQQEVPPLIAVWTAMGKSHLAGLQGGDRFTGSPGDASPEDGSLTLSSGSERGPLKLQSTVEEYYVDGGYPAQVNSPQGLDPWGIVERFVDERRSAPPHRGTMMTGLTSLVLDESDADPLATPFDSRVVAIEEAMRTAAYDMAFGNYDLNASPSGQDAASMSWEAENLNRQEDFETDGGFVGLADELAESDESNLNNAASAHREAIEQSLRSLTSRRGVSKGSLPNDGWLESAWNIEEPSPRSEDAFQSSADEPGGMILLSPDADAECDHILVAVDDVEPIVASGVAVEASIGMFQAFDVSIDDAPAAAIKPASTSDAQESHSQRSGSSGDEPNKRHAVAKIGAAALGAIAIAAKRQTDDRRRQHPAIGEK